MTSREQWIEHVRAPFPGAITSRELILRTFAMARRELGLEPKDILFAQSICADDVNAIEYPEEGRALLGPFNMGGLNGYPFTGRAGVAAFVGHVPEHGAALIFFAPHVGIAADGAFGEILRVGQHQRSACCGAARGALSWLEQGEALGEVPNDDFQLHTLKRLLHEQRARVLAAENRLLAATELFYEAASVRISNLIDRAAFECTSLILMGGILINGDVEHGSAVQLRRLELRDVKSGVCRVLSVAEFTG